MTESEEFEQWYMTSMIKCRGIDEYFAAWQAARAPLLLEIEQLKAEMKEGK